MDKTVIVAVPWQQRHTLYGKGLRRVTKFYAHDGETSSSIGDVVKIEETRPISRTKRWRVIEIIARREVAEVKPIELDEGILTEEEEAKKATEDAIKLASESDHSESSMQESDSQEDLGSTSEEAVNVPEEPEAKPPISKRNAKSKATKTPKKKSSSATKDEEAGLTNESVIEPVESEVSPEETTPVAEKPPKTRKKRVAKSTKSSKSDEKTDPTTDKEEAQENGE